MQNHIAKQISMTLLILLLFAGLTSAATFKVDDDGDPSIYFENLDTALATAATYGPGPHTIEIYPGTYSDAGLAVPTNVGDIIAVDTGVYFVSPTYQAVNFLSVSSTSNLTISGLTISEYQYGFTGSSFSGLTIDGCTFIDNIQGTSMNGAGELFGNTFHDNSSYGLAVAGSYWNIHDNCFYNQPGPQAYDGTGGNWWHDNYFDDLAGTSYAIAGGGGETDYSPVMADNSANDGGVGVYEVFDFVDITIDWTVPACDPDFPALAAYSFTVTYDPSVLTYVSGDYNYDFFGDSAFYGTIDDDTPGQIVFDAVDYVNPGYGSHELAVSQFQVTGIGNTSITISSTYLDSLNNTIYTRNTPLSLTLEDNTPPSISVTTNNPVRDDIYSDGSSAGAGPFIELHIDGSASDQFQLKDIWWNVDGVAWHLISSGIGSDSYTIPTLYYIDYTTDVGEGAHVLNVLVRDMADNRDSVLIPFTVDHTGPSLTSWSMTDPTCPITAGYTNDLTNNVAFVDDGTADSVEFWDGGWSGVKLDYAATTTFDVSAGDGLKSIWARLYDEFNNMGNQSNATITLDQTTVNPSQGWASDNSGDSFPGKTKVATRAVFVDCNFDAAGGTLEYFVSEDINDTACGTAWMAMPPPVRPIPFELSANDGMKTIYFFSRDIAGNTNYTTATIEFDSTNNGFDTFSIKDRAGGCTDYRRIRVEYTYSDADLVEVGLSNTQGGPYSFYSLATYPDSMNNWWLTTGDGLKTVYGVMKDDVGNLSDEWYDEITLDTQDPTADDLELNGGPSTWSQVPEVSVDFVNPSADITQIAMGTTSGVYTDTVAYTGTNTFDFGSGVAQNTWVYLYAQAFDCAGRDLAAEVDGRVAFDFVDPVISDVEINGGATITNDATVDIDFNWTEVSPLYVYFSEDPGMAGAVQLAWSGGPVYVDGFTFSGEGDVTVYVQIEDRSGRMSNIESATIFVDVTPPGAGTVTLRQDPTVNPWAAPGYTNSTTIEIVGITYDSDVDSMYFRNPGGTWVRLAAADSYTPFTLTAGEGVKTVEYVFRDHALNFSPVFTTQITLDQTPSTNPVVSPTAVPSGSVDLAWGAGASDDQFYFLRYNYSGEYPVYGSGVPPFPAIDEGFAGEEADPALAQIFGTSCTFTHPTLNDMFSFSIWAVDMAGNFDPATYGTCSSINYFAGDLDFDGAVEFVDDWGQFATCYTLDDTDPLWVTNNAAVCDIGPTSNGEYWGMPVPDQVIDFSDLTVFGQNYLYHGDHGKSAGAGKIGIPEPVKINIELPDHLAMNTTYTFPITVSNAKSIFAYHLVFGYDNDMIEIVNVETGNIHRDVNSFFYYDRKSSNLDLTGMVLADQFSGDEIARVTIRAKNSTAIGFEEQEVVVRDMENHDINVTVNTVAKSGLVPETFTLKQNYPNPFNPTTTISMFLPKQGEYRLCIYNVTGQLIEEFNGFSDAGEVKIVWDASNVGSGVYFYKATYGDVSAYKKMILLK